MRTPIRLRGAHQGSESKLVGAPVGEWADRAACKGRDTSLFFPDKYGSVNMAKAICAGCDVRAQCLDYALDNGQRFGVWGGLSERERRKVGYRDEIY